MNYQKWHKKFLANKTLFIILFTLCLCSCDRPNHYDFSDRNLPKFDATKVYHSVIVEVSITNGELLWGMQPYIFKTDRDIRNLLNEVAGITPPPLLVITEKNRSLRNNQIYTLIENSDMCKEHDRCYFVRD